MLSENVQPSKISAATGSGVGSGVAVGSGVGVGVGSGVAVGAAVGTLVGSGVAEAPQAVKSVQSSARVRKNGRIRFVAGVLSPAEGGMDLMGYIIGRSAAARQGAVFIASL